MTAPRASAPPLAVLAAWSLLSATAAALQQHAKERDAPDKPSVTAALVSGLHAKAWAKNESDDWVSACIATWMEGDAGEPCDCRGAPPRREDVLTTEAAFQSKHPFETMVFNLLYKDTVARTKAIDASITKLTKQALFDQVVFLGAGYDSRAYRNTTYLRNVRAIFECDLASTLEAKRRVVESCGLQPTNRDRGGLEYVPFDLLAERPFEPLLRSGKFSLGRPTLFLQEHVAEYLDEAANQRWLRSLADLTRRLSPESRLILMCWRGKPLRSKMCLNTYECNKFIMPFAEQDSTRWMRETGWEPATGLEEEVAIYQSVSAHHGYFFSTVSGFMGVFKPVR